MDKRVADRRANFKKNFEDPRRKREDLQVQIRKTHREQNLAKKRAEAINEAQCDGSISAEAAAAAIRGDYPVLSPASTSSVYKSEDNDNTNNNNSVSSGFNPTLLPSMMVALTSGDQVREFEATQAFRRALSIEYNPPIQAVIDAGAVPYFVKFLSNNDRHDLQFEAAWALTNIASGSQEQTRVVIEADAVSKFVALLNSTKEEVREQAVWALGNIAGDSPACRDLVLTSNGLNPLLEQLRNPEAKISMQRNATWTLSNLCRGKPPPDFEYVAPCVPTLSKLIYSDDIDVLTDACWALSYLSDGPNDRIERILESGIANRVVELLLHQCALVQTPALRTIGNFVTGDDQQTQVVIACGAIPNLAKMLCSTRKIIQKEACWALSNITAGNRDQIQAVIDERLIPNIIQMLSISDFDVKKEAAWAVSNAICGGSDEQVKFIVSMECIKPLCDLLDVKDTKIIGVALEAIECILRVGKKQQEDEGLSTNPYCDFVELADGNDALEKLQETANEEIYNKVIRIIYTYFQYEETDAVEPDGSLGFGATAPEGGFQF